MELSILFQFLVALFLGAIIGLEREIKKRGAGIQTYSLVCLGSCIFTTAAMYFFKNFNGTEFDLVRIIQAISIGMGFIGAGTIFSSQKGIEGLTTAAGLWVVAAIGVLIGAGLFSFAVFSTLLVISILAGLGKIEEKYFKD